jgi:restriction system protein
LLRNLWCGSFLLAAVLSALSAALLPKKYAVFGITGGFPLLLMGSVALKRRWKLSYRGWAAWFGGISATRRCA